MGGGKQEACFVGKVKKEAKCLQPLLAREPGVNADAIAFLYAERTQLLLRALRKSAKRVPPLNAESNSPARKSRIAFQQRVGLLDLNPKGVVNACVGGLRQWRGPARLEVRSRPLWALASASPVFSQANPRLA